MDEEFENKDVNEEDELNDAFLDDDLLEDEELPLDLIDDEDEEDDEEKVADPFLNGEFI